MDPGNGDTDRKKASENSSILAVDSGDDAFEFCSSRFQSSEIAEEVAMSTADELFCDGRIRPLSTFASSASILMNHRGGESDRGLHESTAVCEAAGGESVKAQGKIDGNGCGEEEFGDGVRKSRRRDSRAFGSDQGRWMMEWEGGRREVTRLIDLLSRPQEPMMEKEEEDGSGRRRRRWPWQNVKEMMVDLEAMKGRRRAAGEGGEGRRRRLHLGGNAAHPPPRPRPYHLDSSRSRRGPNPLGQNISHNDNNNIHHHSPPPPPSHLDSPSSPNPLDHNLSNNNNRFPNSPIQPLPLSCPLVATTTARLLLLQNHPMPTIPPPCPPHPLRFHKTTYRGSSYTSSQPTHLPPNNNNDDDDGDDKHLGRPRMLDRLAKNRTTMPASPTYPPCSSAKNRKKIKPISIDHLLPSWITGPYSPKKLDTSKPKVTVASKQQLVRFKKVTPTSTQHSVSNKMKIIEARIPEQHDPSKLNTTGPRKDHPRKRLDFMKMDDFVHVKASSKQLPWNVPSYYTRSSTTTTVHNYYTSHIQAQIRISSRKTFLPYKQGLFNCILPSS